MESMTNEDDADELGAPLGASLGRERGGGLLLRLRRTVLERRRTSWLYRRQEANSFDRLSKDFFSDPTQAAVTCVKVGPVELAADVNDSQEGEEVFKQARSLLFKSVKVRGIGER